MLKIQLHIQVRVMYPDFVYLGTWVHLHIFRHFFKGDNYELPIAFPENINLQKRGQLLKERICSRRSKFCPLKVEQIFSFKGGANSFL